ncbi:MAG: hypothetical protein JWM49_1561 [Microbacteriaceae bacterium]|nr:hypothetical protein [Microbacteriaceae bacterium]
MTRTLMRALPKSMQSGLTCGVLTSTRRSDLQIAWILDEKTQRLLIGRQIVAAGECVILSRGVEYSIDRIEPCDAATGLRAFEYPAAFVLRLMRRHEFRFLHESGAG